LIKRKNGDVSFPVQTVPVIWHGCMASLKRGGLGRVAVLRSGQIPTGARESNSHIMMLVLVNSLVMYWNYNFK
jgi:hypothetical protein